jgi:hypothetical protein
VTSIQVKVRSKGCHSAGQHLPASMAKCASRCRRAGRRGGRGPIDFGVAAYGYLSTGGGECEGIKGTHVRNGDASHGFKGRAASYREVLPSCHTCPDTGFGAVDSAIVARLARPRRTRRGLLRRRLEACSSYQTGAGQQAPRMFPMFGRATGRRWEEETKREEEDTSISNRPGKSTYLDEMSVQKRSHPLPSIRCASGGIRASLRSGRLPLDPPRH